MLGARAHRLPARQLGRKGKLTADANAFHPLPHLFFVAKTAVPQSGMCGFVHDRCGNQLRGGCCVQYEAPTELAGTERDVVSCVCSRTTLTHTRSRSRSMRLYRCGSCVLMRQSASTTRPRTSPDLLDPSAAPIHNPSTRLDVEHSNSNQSIKPARQLPSFPSRLAQRPAI